MELTDTELTSLCQAELRLMLRDGAENIHEIGFPWGQFQIKPEGGNKFTPEQLDTLAQIMRNLAAVL
jgi:hypothetical protein